MNCEDEGLDGAGAEPMGPQNWFKEAHGQSAQELPKEDVGPHLPPGGAFSIFHFAFHFAFHSAFHFAFHLKLMFLACMLHFMLNCMLQQLPT